MAPGHSKVIAVTTTKSSVIRAAAQGSASIEGVAGRPSCGNTRFVRGGRRLTVSVTGLQSRRKSRRIGP